MAPDPPPGASSAAGLSGEVIDRLRARATVDGFVPFDQFMDVALYADGVGFYGRDLATLGPAGDFYTATHVHPLFARTIAHRVREVIEPLGRERPVRIVEVGPGDGSLAEGILATWAAAPIPRGLEYLMVERSGPLRRQALERTRAVAESAGIPVRSVPSVSAEGPFAGMVIANELIDALPARRLRWTGTEWVELGVRIEDGAVRSAEAPLRDPVPPPALPDPPETGTVLEVGSAGAAFVREVADHLVAGELLLVDYGMGERELLRAHPRGTLAAVRHHRPIDDPLSAPGETDLSVFVNFDRLRSAARAAGLAEVAFRSQAEALGAWGFPALFDAALREVRSGEEEVRLRLAAKNLLFGFERFCALELAPAAPPAATGRAVAPR